MRVLLITKYFYPAVGFGGPVQCTYNLSKYLVKKGHEVTVYTTDAFDPNLNSKIKDRFRLINGAEVFFLRNIIQNDILFLNPSIIRALERNIGDFDVVHLHEFRTFQNFAFHRLRRKDAPYVLSFHGEFSYRNEETSMLLLRRFFDYTFGKRLIKDASKLHALTKFEASQFIQSGIKEDKIAIIPNGVASEDFANPPPFSYFKQLFEIDEDKMILYVGRVHKRKGIAFLVKAFSLLAKNNTDVKLVIAGPDHGFLRPLKEIASGLDLNDRILFTGSLNRKQVIAAYNDADVVAYSSLQEGFPIVPLEAALMGRPLVVSDDPSVDFVKESNCGIVVEYGNVAHLAEALNTVLEDAALAKKFGQNGKDLVLKNFTWSKIADKMEDMYLETLK